MTKTIIILAIAAAFVAGTLMTTTQVFARDIGPISEFHIEVPCNNGGQCTPLADLDAFDFDNQAYSTPSTPGADVRLALCTEGEVLCADGDLLMDFLGYQKLVGLNGATLANLGLVDFASTSCSDFATALLSDTISTALPGDVVPTSLTVYLVETGEGTKVKLQLQQDGVDFTAPNGLRFDYEILECVQRVPVRDNVDIENIKLKNGQFRVIVDNAGIGGTSDVEITWVFNPDKCVLYAAGDVGTATIGVIPLVDDGALSVPNLPLPLALPVAHNDVDFAEAIVLGVNGDAKDCKIDHKKGQYVSVSTIGMGGPGLLDTSNPTGP